ncbi:MAG: hypothetical protein PVI57_23010, partial [Gemmatimonadota bacterium]
MKALTRARASGRGLRMVPVALAVVTVAVGEGTDAPAAAQEIGGPPPQAGGAVVRLPGPDRPIHLNLEPLWSVGSVQGQWWE